MVVSQNRGPQYEPHYTIVLIIGTPKKVPLILGNPHIQSRCEARRPLLYWPSPGQATCARFKGLEFKVLGFRVFGLRVLGFRVRGFRVLVLGLRV